MTVEQVNQLRAMLWTTDTNFVDVLGGGIDQQSQRVNIEVDVTVLLLLLFKHKVRTKQSVKNRR